MNRRNSVVYLLIIVLWMLAACARPSETPGPIPGPDTVETESNRDGVFTIGGDGRRQILPAPRQAFLKVGEGVDVDVTGRAILRFADLFTVEVLRDAELVLDELSADEQSAFVTVLQNGGALLNDFNPQQEINRRFRVQTEFAIITATGTRFLVVREANTPLEWVVGLDAEEGDLEVTANGVTKPVTTGVARWIAPIGEPSDGISADMQNVQDWIDSLRRGVPGPEVGEVLWSHADILANTEPLEELPPPGEPFELEGVILILDPQGLFGGPDYWLEDCNDDGVQDIAMDGGILWMDFRPVLSRVRALDVTVINWDEPETGFLAVFDPAENETRRQPLGVGFDQGQVLSLRSEPGEPYHYAELAMSAGCFLGFSLTPPRPDGQPGDPRPAAEIGEAAEVPTLIWTPAVRTPTRTPVIRTPTRTPTVRIPTRTPTATPQPRCTVNAGTLNLREGPSTQFGVVDQMTRGTIFEGLERTADATWIFGASPRAEGWTSAAYLACNYDLSQLPVARTLPPTYTPTPTATPTPTRLPETRIDRFAPDEAAIQACGCTTLRWDVENAVAVYLGSESVKPHGSREVCLQETQTYTLRVAGYAGDLERSTTVQVVYKSVDFRADDTTLTSGECTTLRWDVENIIAVYLDGKGVVGHGKQKVCPKQTQTYTLRVVTACGDQDHRVTIEVKPSSGLAAPKQISPKNGSVFDHYPRTTTLKWSAVPGDTAYIRYTVEIDCYHCCKSNAWCTDVGRTWKVVPNLYDNSYTFNWVGAQPGRWRVWAVHTGTGQESPKTGWWEFRYTR